MEFVHIFSILSVVGALLFFSAGFAAGMLNGGRVPEKPEVLIGDGAAEETVLRETAAREMAATEAVARESAARLVAANDAAVQHAECERLRAQLAACQNALNSTKLRAAAPEANGSRAAALDAECARLRSEAKAAAVEIARLRSAMAEIEHRAGKDPSLVPPVMADTLTGGTTFQGILGRLSKTKGMRAAVLGDALGLPVASFGEQAESLAGFSGFISQAASKARDFLQLGNIRRIVIEDERLATLTACSVPGNDLFLATLTQGPGPEFVRMVQVLNDVKSFMSQRSPS
jgi:hypothetical protein